MTQFSKLMLAAACTAVLGQSEDQFAHGGGICASANEDTTVKIGQKGNASCTTASLPAEYFSYKQLALATMVGGNTAYLTDATKVAVIDKTTGVNGSSTVSAQAFSLNNGTTTYAVAKSGSLYGTPAATGSFGFVGTSSMLMTKGELEYNENEFAMLTPNLAANPVTVSSAATTICVLKVDNGTCLATKRKATAGTYKYSLFGYTAGDGFAAYMANANATRTHFAVRNQYNVKTMGGDKFTLILNDGGAKALKDQPASLAGVTKVTLQGAKTAWAVSFPTEYNVGKLATPISLATMKTKTVQINFAKVANSTEAFYLDFLFAADADGLNAKDGFFAYDPEIKATQVQAPVAATNAAGKGGNTTAGPDASGAAVVQVGVTMGLIASALFLF